MYDIASNSDTQILNNLLNNDKYQILKSYDIKVGLFVKYGKRDKEGNLKTPAISKNGIAVPAQIKLVSNFNRITDDIDVKIILNAELWEELTSDEKVSTLDNMLTYLEIKEDKNGEPLTISDSCDKVQLKLKHPDFYCEGFISVLNVYKEKYIPWQNAKSITELVNNTNIVNTNNEKIQNNKENKKSKEQDISVNDLIDEIENER